MMMMCARLQMDPADELTDLLVLDTLCHHPAVVRHLLPTAYLHQ